MFEALHTCGSPVGERINPSYCTDEAALIRELAATLETDPAQLAAIEARAADLVEAVRADRADESGIDSFLGQYDLSSGEGVALMCLAEALLRIPDAPTADLLIADRLAAGDWRSHVGESDSLFVNASTWGLMLTGRLVRLDAGTTGDPGSFVGRLIARLGEPLVRTAFMHAMRIIGRQFIMGRDIGDALRRAGDQAQAYECFSFDMLGEAALTDSDAQRYCDAYAGAIRAAGEMNAGRNALMDGAGVSIKLSALSPRLEFMQSERVWREVVPRLTMLARLARERCVPLTVDAEEAERLELTLRLFEAAGAAAGLDDWGGFGIAVQAYQRRATAVIDWLRELAVRQGRVIPVRLVKGAYWDTEIKLAQVAGLPSYPVFTRKVNTDISYLACVHRLLAAGDALWPQFATHNAHTVAYLQALAGDAHRYEFQRLHGMGDALYRHLAATAGGGFRCRVYAPVGQHADLLPYLVRRLLENGANTSFVNRIVDSDLPAGDLVRQPAIESDAPISNPAIPAPPDLYGAARRNSAGFNVVDGAAWRRLAADMDGFLRQRQHAAPSAGATPTAGRRVVTCTAPADGKRAVGEVEYANAADVDAAIGRAHGAFAGWMRTDVAERARLLRDTAEAMERGRAALVALCVAEAGRCIPDALAEVREAVDFLRYYAAGAERLMAVPEPLPGPTGESNELSVAARGVFVCISPWNFPISIFTGQIAAALATGNTVVAKPAEQTCLVAAHIVALFHAAGVPADALQFVPGDGETGARAVASPAVAGVVFTGSTATAVKIHRTLAARDGPLPVLIAETGGQNAMLVDSSALPEQVVLDVVQSAFNSAGQRCSALRLLFVHEAVADRLIGLLAGHMATLRVGDPACLATDVGPVIDREALEGLRAYRRCLLEAGHLIYECDPGEAGDGYFFAPLAVEIDATALPEAEVFGPVLHVVRFGPDDVDRVIERIEQLGYGLTFGIQTRIESRLHSMAERVRVGNVYGNRNMIGAVVGTQPFGGLGRSGTGPKAGGPHYLLRFVTEKSISINTAAIGGNATLLARPDR